jgi:hypothetical protein
MIEFMRFLISFTDEVKEIGFLQAVKSQAKKFWDCINDPKYNQDSFRD